jgi:hypothetical protein
MNDSNKNKNINYESNLECWIEYNPHTKRYRIQYEVYKGKVTTLTDIHYKDILYRFKFTAKIALKNLKKRLLKSAIEKQKNAKWEKL